MKELLKEKLEEVEAGAVVEMEPDEAEELGAMADNAIAEDEAMDSRFDREV